MKFKEFIQSEEARKPHYLLIGNPVGHSISPLMHNAALEYYGLPERYVAVEVSLPELPSLIAHFNQPSFKGANVTIPHKENLFDAVDVLSAEAVQIGAINTIVKQQNRLIGDNTDAYGFGVPIAQYSDILSGERAIIFGTGGATKAIFFALKEMNIEEIVMVSRRPGNYDNTFDQSIVRCSYENWPAYADEAAIIVNATPLGMVPNTDASPVPDSDKQYLADKICYDIVYNPRNTKFLKQAAAVGGIPIEGLDMLIYQGAKSFRLWTGKEFPVSLIKMRLEDVFPA